MNVTFQAIDLNACHAAGDKPAHIIKRQAPDERWLVITGFKDGAFYGSEVKSGNFVQVPLLYYHAEPNGGFAVAYAAYIGIGAMRLFAKHDVIRAHIAYANVVEDVVLPNGQQVYSLCIGIAVQIQ